MQVEFCKTVLNLRLGGLIMMKFLIQKFKVWLFVTAIVVLGGALAACGAPPQAPGASEASGQAPSVGQESDSQSPAAGESITLKVAGAYPEGNVWHEPIEAFIEEAAKRSGGRLKIEFVGGPEAIPQAQLGESLKRGVIDMTLVPAQFYAADMPEIQIMKLSPLTPEEERTKGVTAYWDELHREKMNARYLNRLGGVMNFHLFLNEPIETADLTGLTIRSAPAYNRFLQSLGAAPVSIPGPEIYSAMQRGVVDGFVYPNLGVTDLALQEVTKYRVIPGFYQIEFVTLVNLDTWNKLPQDLQEIMETIAVEQEKSTAQSFGKLIADEDSLRKSQGMEDITLPDAEAKKLLDAAEETGWAEIEGIVSGDVVEKFQSLYGD